MRTKKILLISITVLFCLSVFLCLFLLFSVKDVNIEYNVYADSDDVEIKEIESRFDKYSNKNLLFIKTEEVSNVLADNPYYEIIAVKKDYPNVLSVEIRERRKAFYIFDEDVIYETTKEGIVLNSYSSVELGNRDMIYTTLTGVSVIEATKGQVIKTSEDELITAVFDMASEVNLTDCINEITVEKATGKELVNFKTYTGTVIQITNACDNGVAKINKAYNDYYEKADDYEKTRNYLIVFENAQGEIEIHWSENEYGKQA